MRAEFTIPHSGKIPRVAARVHRADAPFLSRIPGSVLYTAGRTRVLCTAIIEEGVPPFLLGKEKGWATAEYDLLPGSTVPRHARERNGKLSGRTQEIQRLIGRAIRASLDLTALTGLTLKLDCDVIEADGGTRTASVNGAWIATALAVADRMKTGVPLRSPILRQVGAISVGLVRGDYLLDLDYDEDSRADVDLTVAMDDDGKLIEVQGTAEGQPFEPEDLARMIAMARTTLDGIFKLQREAVAGANRS